MRFTLSYACVLHAALLTSGYSPTATSGINLSAPVTIETKVGARLTSLLRRRAIDADPSPRAHVRRMHMHADIRLATQSPVALSGAAPPLRHGRPRRLSPSLAVPSFDRILSFWTQLLMVVVHWCFCCCAKVGSRHRHRKMGMGLAQLMYDHFFCTLFCT